MKDNIEEIKNYAAKWFGRGRDYGKAPITKDVLAELEEDGEKLAHQIDQLARQVRLDRPELRETIVFILAIKESQRCGTERCSQYDDCKFCLADQILALIPDMVKAERERILNILEDALKNCFVMVIADPEGETRESTIDPITIREIIQALKKGE